MSCGEMERKAGARSTLRAQRPQDASGVRPCRGTIQGCGEARTASIERTDSLHTGKHNLVAATPIPHINTPSHALVNTGIRPVDHACHVTVLHRIPVDVIHVTRIVRVITNAMFPKPPFQMQRSPRLSWLAERRSRGSMALENLALMRPQCVE